MHLSVFAADSNPAVDRRMCRKSPDYCSLEVTEKRAFWVHDEHGRRIGIKLFTAEAIQKRERARDSGPSMGERGTISMRTSRLNCEHKCPSAPELDPVKAERELRMLAVRQESMIEQAIAERRPIPHKARVIGAHAKITAFPFLCDKKATRVAVGLCRA